MVSNDSPPKPAPITPASLAALLSNLSLTKSPPSCDADDYLTAPDILSAYQTLVADLANCVQLGGLAPQSVSLMLPVVFEHAFSALCKPYRKALGSVSVLQATITNHEVTISNHEATIKTLEAKIKSHEPTITHLEAEIKDVRTEAKDLRAENKNLQATTMSLQNELKDLALEKSNDIMQLRIEKSETIQAVTAEMNTALREKMAGPVTMICVPGSVSRRETWEKVKAASGTILNSPVPVCNDKLITEKAVSRVVKRKYNVEAEMYEPVTKCVAKYLSFSRTNTHPGTKVVDTHGRFYLDGQAPDITITVKDIDFVDSASVVAIIELKPPSPIPMAAECFGQVYDYLRKLSTAQPNRRKLVGLLSNLTQNHIIIHDTPHQGVVRVCHYESTTFAKALRFLKHLILNDTAILPSIPSFSVDLGILEARLGSPVFSVIGIFTYSTDIISPTRWMSPGPITPGDKIVVKRTSFAPPRMLRPSMAQSLIAARTPRKPSPRPVADEISILRLIRDAGGPKSLPFLVYHSLDMNEFGMTPLGQSIDLHTLNQAKARKILREVLTALQWLHAHRIIHRDVRWDNIVVPLGGDAVLIDFGAAVLDDGALRDYEGGIVCAPTRVIGDPDRRYRPSPADDCAAWVLLVNALLTPTRWAGMRSEEIMFKGTAERERIQGLWRTLETSAVWGPGVAAAKAVDYEGMLGLLDLVVLL